MCFTCLCLVVDMLTYICRYVIYLYQFLGMSFCLCLFVVMLLVLVRLHVTFLCLSTSMLFVYICLQVCYLSIFVCLFICLFCFVCLFMLPTFIYRYVHVSVYLHAYFPSRISPPLKPGDRRTLNYTQRKNCSQVPLLVYACLRVCLYTAIYTHGGWKGLVMEGG